MSEELLQTLPQQIGKYTYYRLGSTSLAQLRNNGIIPKKSYQKLERKKPDGLVVYHGQIRAVVEYKQPKELRTERQISKAIGQELEVARALCKILIVTDGAKSFWVNALTGDRIKNAQGDELRTVFHPFPVKDTVTLEYLFDELDSSISKRNSTMCSVRLIDPTPLATRLWQTIWVATGKSPVKCLYNVVELFIFKFLSDLGVLDEDIAFASIHKKSLTNPEKALEFYARNARKKIYQLFPAGRDGTTIINGTIFVTELGEPNLSQSILFARSLGHLHRYAEEFGSFTKISKQFKTKLYQSFLQQEAEALGQYFTPRKVIQSVIRMAGADSHTYQFSGKRICDPFCGVGGFPLELLNMNEAMHACYAPNTNGVIRLPFVLHGFDKGFERDDERTVILAKANMLIYLAELLFRYHNCSKEFARIFNETFTLFRDNLGTFGHILDREEEKYDLILSNPPYVTSGSSIIKEEIAKTPRTASKYPINALGLEGLSIEWIIQSLKRGGRAFVVIPDGILGRADSKLRNYILRECYLDAIVSLPDRTFFANFERTYILAITKKMRPEDVQVEPVFTYLVSNIGERLTSVRREEIEEDDLPEMERLFRFFMADKVGAKEALERLSPRCKIQPFAAFAKGPHWVVDRWWTRQERDVLDGNTVAPSTTEEIEALAIGFQQLLSEYSHVAASDGRVPKPTREIALGDTKYFRLFIGKRVLRREVSADETLVPVYSANVFEPMGYIEASNIKDFTNPMILWGIDGNFEFNLMPVGVTFATTDHCGVIEILDSSIDPEFILYALNHQRQNESFDRSFRASLANMRRFVVQIPVTRGGSFNLAAQRTFAARRKVVAERRVALEVQKKLLDSAFERYQQ